MQIDKDLALAEHEKWGMILWISASMLAIISGGLAFGLPGIFGGFSIALFALLFVVVMDAHATEVEIEIQNEIRRSPLETKYQAPVNDGA